MEISEYVDERELADALDPAVGDGTPETAPALTPEDELDATDGLADEGDDDEIEDDDETQIDAEI